MLQGRCRQYLTSVCELQLPGTNSPVKVPHNPGPAPAGAGSSCPLAGWPPNKDALGQRQQHAVLQQRSQNLPLNSLPSAAGRPRLGAAAACLQMLSTPRSSGSAGMAGTAAPSEWHQLQQVHSLTCTESYGTMPLCADALREHQSLWAFSCSDLCGCFAGV